MTDKKEQARKLRDSATILSNTYGAILEMQRIADDLDPPAKERWERVRGAAQEAAQLEDSQFWSAALVEADKGRISEAKLREWVEAQRRSAEFGHRIVRVVPVLPLLAAIDSGELRGE